VGFNNYMKKNQEVMEIFRFNECLKKLLEYNFKEQASLKFPEFTWSTIDMLTLEIRIANQIRWVGEYCSYIFFCF
jgi:hypothetical protein